MDQAEPNSSAATNLHAGTILVDTSLLIEQQKQSRQAQPVRDALAAYSFRGISSYSKLEFKRAWLQRLHYVYRACCDPECRGVFDVLGVLERRLAGNYQLRPVKTCLSAVVRFLELESRAISGKAQVARLRAHCRNAILSSSAALKEMATGEFRGTGCVRAEEFPTEHPGGYLDVTMRRCKPSNIQCRVHTFFTENRAKFSEIADYADHNPESSKELRAMRDHIRQAEKESTHLCNDKHCAKVADAIVAVDGKGMDVYAANNDPEWRPLAQIMGKTLINPVSGKQYVNAAR